LAGRLHEPTRHAAVLTTLPAVGSAR
jgi:hypothetical protein